MLASAPAQPLIRPGPLSGAEGEAAGEPPLAIWLGFGIALLFLAGAGWLARRVRPAGADEAPTRFRRIFDSAAAFGAVNAVKLGADEIVRVGFSWRMLPMMALAGFTFAVVGLILFGIIDFWLGLAGPRRTRRWLVAAILVFALIVTGGFALALWAMDDVQSLLHPAMLEIVGIAAAVGILWWSRLPPPRADVASRFE